MDIFVVIYVSKYGGFFYSLFFFVVFICIKVCTDVFDWWSLVIGLYFRFRVSGKAYFDFFIGKIEEEFF